MFQLNEKMKAVTTLAGFLILSCTPAEGDERDRNTPITELPWAILSKLSKRLWMKL